MKSKSLYKKIKKLNNYSFSAVRHFWHSEIGYNSRLSNLEAALGVGQLTHVDATLQKKERIHQWYKEELSRHADMMIPLTVPSYGTSNYWHIAYRLQNAKLDRMALRNYLAQSGIETRGFFVPMHLQPPYRKKWQKSNFPHADMLAQTGFLLPSGSGLTRDQVSFICARIRSFIKIHHGTRIV